MAPVASEAVAVPAALHFPLDWEESPADVTVTVQLGSEPVPKMDVRVRFQRRHLLVSVRGAVVCDGELAHAVDPSESFWSLEQEPGKIEEAPPLRTLVLSLTKAVPGQRWWILWSKEANEAGLDAVKALAPSVVIGSSRDLGDEEVREDVEEQRRLERELEPQYLSLVREKGLESEETLLAFFRLFNEKIQLYKLSELDGYLKDIVPVCRRRTDNFRIQALQALSTVRMKQSRVQEGLDLLLEIESYMGAPSEILDENIAYGYSELGAHKSAEERYRRSLRMQEAQGKPARGSTLLGLAVTYRGTGRLQEALEVAQKAYATYGAIAAGRPSSLQAKCGVEVASIHCQLGDFEPAAAYLQEAVSAYEVTCGEESPLMIAALEHLGPVLLKLGQTDKAKAAFRRAYELEVLRDAVDFEKLVHFHMQLMLAHTDGVTMLDRSEFRDYFGLIDRAVARARGQEPTSGKPAVLPMLLKLAGETKAYGADYGGAMQLLEEALPYLQARAKDGSTSAAAGLSVTEKLLRLCEQCLSGARTPPMKLSVEDKEYALLTPPTRPNQQVAQKLAERRQKETAAEKIAQEASTGASFVSSPGPLIEELCDEPPDGTTGVASSSALPLHCGQAGDQSLPGDQSCGAAGPSSEPGSSTLASAANESPPSVPSESCKDAGARSEPSSPTPALHCRELLPQDFEALERLWTATSTEHLFPSQELLSRHLAANQGLSFVSERGGQVLGFSIAGAAGPFGIIRQVVATSLLPLPSSSPASPSSPALEQEARALLVDCTAAALRAAGCTSVEVLVPRGESQQFWERRARGPARSAFAI